jgi:ribosome production factor 2
MLKKPHAVNFTKKNQIHPFEDHSNLQFFSQKNDASLFVIGTHSKKRPNTLTFARMFDHQLLDMMEVSIEKGTPMKDFKVLFTQWDHFGACGNSRNKDGKIC